MTTHLGVVYMLGFLVNDQEQKEIEYLLKREMEEILMDLEDYRIDASVKKAMTSRYQTLFQLFKRIAPKDEYLKYLTPVLNSMNRSK